MEYRAGILLNCQGHDRECLKNCCRLEETKEIRQQNAVYIPEWSPGPDNLKTCLGQLAKLKFE